MPKPATFIALPMSINPRKWYLAYLVMLIYFKIVILSVTFQQSVTTYKLLRFRLLCQKVMLWVFCSKLFLLINRGNRSMLAALQKKDWKAYARLTRRTFLPVEVSAIYASLGEP